ncbi:hypothetical protein HDU92_008577 [Lobulomyces angularis]|nr:hypothetical protein HDU92_008577 [Lobulomyces angularis]
MRKEKIRLNASSREVYIERNTVGLIKENFVVIDPNKRDLLYCVGLNNQKLRYTQPQREVDTRKKKYRKIRVELTTIVGINNIQMNVTVPHSTCDPIAFNIYLRTFFSGEKLRSYGDGRKTTVIIGDWDSGGNTIVVQVTTKGRIQDFKDLSCHGETLETFERRMNPKPWKNDEVSVHGLLRCQSEFCQQSNGYSSRLWNRDDVATLNQRLFASHNQNGTQQFASSRQEANEQLRKRLIDIGPLCPLGDLYGVSTFGTKYTIYNYIKDNHCIEPLPTPSNHNLIED